MWSNIKTTSGFTLTEVMIGITILTVAIVSATNLLVGLIDSNKNNLTTMQAYYLAQEGIEGVRNIRDTNWLHNRDWLGEGSQALWGRHFESGSQYSLGLEFDAFRQGPSYGLVGDLGLISHARPWSIADDGRLFRHSDGENVYLGSSGVGGEDSGFSRMVRVTSYDEDAVLVEAVVRWKLGSRDRELVLSEVLTNWKGGAL